MSDNPLKTEVNAGSIQGAALKINGVPVDVTDNDVDDGMKIIQQLIGANLPNFVVDTNLLKYAKSVKATKAIKSILWEIMRQLPLLMILYIQYANTL